MGLCQRALPSAMQQPQRPGARVAEESELCFVDFVTLHRHYCLLPPLIRKKKSHKTKTDPGLPPDPHPAKQTTHHAFNTVPTITTARDSRKQRRCRPNHVVFNDVILIGDKPLPFLLLVLLVPLRQWLLRVVPAVVLGKHAFFLRRGKGQRSTTAHRSDKLEQQFI